MEQRYKVAIWHSVKKQQLVGVGRLSYREILKWRRRGYHCVFLKS